MSEATFLLDQQNKIVNVSYDIKQFTVKSNNQFPIYVKIGGIPATIKDYDYLIQGNSDFTSPLIGANTLSIYTPITNSHNTSEITVYDYKHSEPNNTPYNSGLSVVNLDKFPFTTTDGFNIVLPPITFNTLTPVYFYTDSIVPLLLCQKVDTDVYHAIGYSNPLVGDGVIAYTPTILGVPIQLYLNKANPSDANPITVYCTYSNTPIYKNSVGKINTIRNIVSLSTYNSLASLPPPAFKYRLSVYLNSGAGGSCDINVGIILTNDSLKNKIVLLPTTNYVITSLNLSATGSFEIQGITLVELTDYKFINVQLDVNAVTGFVDFNCEVWDFNS